jgi:hypothetical protein
MRIGKKIVPIILVGVLGLSVIFTISGCRSKPTASTTTSVNTAIKTSTSTSQIATTSKTTSTTVSPSNVTVSDGLESVSVPNGWNTNDSTLYPGAVIGASDVADGLYFIVTKKPLSSYATINDYMNTAVKGAFSLVVNNPVWGNTSNVKIGGDSGLTLQLTGMKKSDNSDFTYYINVLSGKDFYYTVCGYTPSAKASVNKTILQTIINSFKEAN